MVDQSKIEKRLPSYLRVLRALLNVLVDMRRFVQFRRIQRLHPIIIKIPQLEHRFILRVWMVERSLEVVESQVFVNTELLVRLRGMLNIFSEI